MLPEASTVAVTLNAAIGGGVLVTTGADIYGASNTCPYACTLTVAGASNSKMLITFSPDLVRIEVDDGVASNGVAYVNVTGSPFNSLPNYCF